MRKRQKVTKKRHGISKDIKKSIFYRLELNTVIKVLERITDTMTFSAFKEERKEGKTQTQEEAAIEKKASDNRKNNYKKV